MTTTKSELFLKAHSTAREVRKHFASYRAAFAEALRGNWSMFQRGVFTKQSFADIVSHLSCAARRALQFGATEKQVKYLASLIEKAGERAEGVITSGMLTKRQASFYIDQYKAGA